MDNGSAEDAPVVLYVGQHGSQRSTKVTQSLLGTAHARGYDFVTIPITTRDFQSRVLTELDKYAHSLKLSTEHTPSLAIAPLTPGESDLSPEESNSALIGVVSPWLDLGSPDPLIACVSRQVFNLEVAYAAFCGVCNILVCGPIPGSDLALYARALWEGVGLGPYVQLHVVMPMAGELEMEGDESTHLSSLARPEYLEDFGEDDPDTKSDVFESWEIWNRIRTLCDYSTKVVIALEVPRQLPSVSLQSRWFSEPVRQLLFPRTSFSRNAKGFPVLSHAQQTLFSRFLRLRYPPWIMLVDTDQLVEQPDVRPHASNADPTPAEACASTRDESHDSDSHLRYFRRLQQTQPARPPIERFGQGYQDYIQSPLQPLTDNLESVTYEVFEKDPIKYEWYERAVAAALRDLRTKLGEEHEIVVAVVGAGRGPLVTRSLQASASARIPIKCCAVEKNPHAHTLIQRRNLSDPLWNNQVLIYKSDMRAWPGPAVNGEIRKVDVLVSELLGSFADNELSPECLDGVQHVLHPEHGINIPQSYNAFLTPISSPRLYTDLLSRPGDDKWELPAVVMLHQYDYLSVLESAPPANDASSPDTREAWSFQHPLRTSILSQAFRRAGGANDCGGWTGGDGKNEHNARYCKLTFKAQDRGVCHGLAGFFETVLYKSTDGSKVELSTNPATMGEKSKDMISWFPIFFPLKKPLHISDHAEIEVSMWRQTDDRKVWYEWIVEVFQKVGRQRVQLGMSELHSSVKNGCLM